jgi:hypothetical protein
MTGHQGDAVLVNAPNSPSLSSGFTKTVDPSNIGNRKSVITQDMASHILVIFDDLSQRTEAVPFDIPKGRWEDARDDRVRGFMYAFRHQLQGLGDCSRT